jgi:MoaA/NifB/PqqE/SkfB family radical SAM enzyme
LPDVERILRECPDLNVTVALGIDGLKEDHDKIRQKPGSWEIATDTARKLQQLKREFPRLDVQTCTCFMNSNQDRIFEWYDFLKYDLKPDKINVNYIRPPSARPKELEIDLNRYRKLAGRIDEDSRTAAIKNSYSGTEGIFKAAIDIYMHELIARTEIEHKAQLRCWAGTAGAVIYDEGTISSCENLESVGNLRNYGWDFQAFWQSEEMSERRKHVKNGCYCTHESNCYYPSLAFNPGHLIQIKRLEKQMRSARKDVKLDLQPA